MAASQNLMWLAEHGRLEDAARVLAQMRANTESILFSGDREKRRQAMIAAHGQPAPIAAADALALARNAGKDTGGALPQHVHAMIYRDDGAADAWLRANRDEYGHPALARVQLPDGRCVGIIDLRPALGIDRDQARPAEAPAGD